MLKLVVIALLSVSALAAVKTLGSTCTAGTNGYDDNGTCKFCHPTCKTCVNGTAAGCVTCHASGTFDTNCEAPAGGSATGAACACAGTKLLTVKTLDGSAYDFQCCNAKGDLKDVTACPVGFGRVQFGTGTQNGCLPCGDAQAACKACDNTGTADSTAVKAECTACFAGAVNASKGCDVTSGKSIQRWEGEVASCATGYYSDATSKICAEIMANCKTQTKANECDECNAKWGVKADKSGCELCINGKIGADKKCLITGCTEHDATDATKCKAEKCDTAAGFAKNTEAATCACEKFKHTKETAATATDGKKVECADCGETCAAGSSCSSDGTKCTKDAPTIACDDTPLKDSGCTTCAKATEGDMKDKYVCSACRDGTKLSTHATKACICNGGVDVEAWNKATNACVKCAAKCTTAGSTSCNLGTDGKATCGAAPVTIGTDATGTDAADSGILISAISMIIAVILA